ncbi:guanylate-binding protein, partial [Rhizophagus diaphanus]
CYEPFNIIKLVEWNDKFINIQITRNESNKITTDQRIISVDDFDEYKNSLTNFEVDLHICILSTNYKSLKIDYRECEYSLDLIGYILTKNERLADGIDRSFTDDVQKDISKVSNIQNPAKDNRFGRVIVFHEGAPVQLLNYREKSENGKFGQIVLNPKALDIIREINEPLAIFSVVGSYRHGKSWFANVLHGRHDRFDLGAEVGGCTHGIYMWSLPFKLTSEQPNSKITQKRVIVLDSEWIDDPSQDENWATKLFILCLVISSTLVYNINGVVGKEDIEKLHLMADLSNFIKEPEYGDFLPKLVILLHDFNLETPDTAAAIRRFFCDFDQPGCKRKMLQHMEKINTDELDEDFVIEVESAVKSIYSQLPLKYIGSSTMQGISFVKFLENVVKHMNSSEILTLLSIPSEYESIIQFVTQEAIKESIDRYEKSMSTLRNEKGKLQLNGEISNSEKRFIEESSEIKEYMKEFEHLPTVISKKEKAYGVIPYMDLKDHSCDLTKKSDIYSLVICFWELTSRKLPFDFETKNCNNMVIEKMNKRFSPKMIRERWTNNFDPRLCHDSFDEVEKLYIIKWVKKYKNQYPSTDKIKWKILILEMKDKFGKLRSENKVKNFWHSKQRQKGRNPSGVNHDISYSLQYNNGQGSFKIKKDPKMEISALINLEK